MESIEDLSYESIFGQDILAHSHEVARFRIQYFRDFPYLYEGNFDYEKKYLESYSLDEKSILIKVTDRSGKLLAVSTALPLITPSDILDGAPALFKSLGYQPDLIFYYGEIILDYSIRGKGVAKKVYSLQDQYARDFGYEQIAIATVVRDDEDPRKPLDYLSTDGVWKRLGFESLPLQFWYHWPTIQENGAIEDAENPMRYWIKDLR